MVTNVELTFCMRNSYERWVFYVFRGIYKEFLYDLDIKNCSSRTIKWYKNNNKAFLNYLTS